MSVATVKAALLAKLGEMTSFKAVYGRETGNPTGSYPVATLTIRDGDGRFASNQHNLRRQGYWVRVYQEQSKQGQGVQGAENIVVSTLDELQTALDMDTTLSGVCKYVNVVGYSADYVDRELDTRILEIQIDAYELTASQ